MFIGPPYVFQTQTTRSQLAKHIIICPLQMYELHTNYRPERFILRNQVVIYFSTQAMFMQQDVCSWWYLQVPPEIQDFANTPKNLHDPCEPRLASFTKNEISNEELCDV
jgi:hypothetical protein